MEIIVGVGQGDLAYKLSSGQLLLKDVCHLFFWPVPSCSPDCVGVSEEQARWRNIASFSTRAAGPRVA